MVSNVTIESSISTQLCVQIDGINIEMEDKTMVNTHKNDADIFINITMIGQLFMKNWKNDCERRTIQENRANEPLRR